MTKLEIYEVGTLPIIEYPSKGAEEVFDRNDTGCMEGFLADVCSLNGRLIRPDAKYGIAIIWNEGKNRMTDLWFYSQLDEWGSGPLVNVRVFRNLKPYTPNSTKSEGHTAGNGLVLLGREKEHRWAAPDLKAYLETRPELPAQIRLGEDFYPHA